MSLPAPDWRRRALLSEDSTARATAKKTLSAMIANALVKTNDPDLQVAACREVGRYLLTYKEYVEECERNG